MLYRVKVYQVKKEVILDIEANTPEDAKSKALTEVLSVNGWKPTATKFVAFVYSYPKVLKDRTTTLFLSKGDDQGLYEEAQEDSKKRGKKK